VSKDPQCSIEDNLLPHNKADHQRIWISGNLGKQRIAPDSTIRAKNRQSSAAETTMTLLGGEA